MRCKFSRISFSCFTNRSHDNVQGRQTSLEVLPTQLCGCDQRACAVGCAIDRKLQRQLTVGRRRRRDVTSVCDRRHVYSISLAGCAGVFPAKTQPTTAKLITRRLLVCTCRRFSWVFAFFGISEEVADNVVQFSSY